MKHIWKFLHNGLAHPLMATPIQPRWITRFHDWTADKWLQSEEEDFFTKD